MKKKEHIALMPSCAPLKVPGGSGLWLAHGCLLLLTRLDSHALVGPPSGRSGAPKWRKDYASSRMLLFFPVLDFLWSSLLLVILVIREEGKESKM